MKLRFFFSALFCAFSVLCRAEIPSPEKLLPNDTLVLVTTPDLAKLRDAFKTSSQGQAWNDAGMKPFRDKFISKFTGDIIEPLEKELGIKLSDYTRLAQGQVTFALTQNGWQGKTNESLG
ncbi:MAG: hypothetical protein ABI042_17305, partial [Verrucomicrobiota bacterium]